MPPPRKILIADADPATARALAPGLRQQGWQVHVARDGARALQLAILRTPDVVLLDEDCPLLDARTFARIVRTNPRTARIRVVLLSAHGNPDRTRLGAVLQKPLHPDEALARVEQLWRRAEAARTVGADGRELAGNLAQMPLVDLLQVLGQNRKSGRLDLSRGGEPAEIHIQEGRAVDARCGPVEGEKALFRLLARREGPFVFHTGRPEGTARIERRMDELVLEGFRQADEAAALWPGLPAPADRLELATAPARVPSGLHPVTAEVVALLGAPLALAELLDRTQASDLETLRAVAELLEKGLARRLAAPPRAQAAAPFLGPAELHQLRARVARGRWSGVQAVGKVVVAGGPEARRAALARLDGLPGFAAERAPAAGLGALGRLDLGDGLRLDLTALPLAPDLLPAWRAFAAGAVGALLLLPAEGLGEGHAALLRDLHLPAVACGPAAGELPEALAEAAAYGGADAVEALRALLAGAGRPAATRFAPP